MVVDNMGYCTWTLLAADALTMADFAFDIVSFISKVIIERLNDKE